VSEAVIQIVALLGSLAVLAAYGASQTRRLSTASLAYILLNLVGSSARWRSWRSSSGSGASSCWRASGRWSASGACSNMCADAPSSPPDIERSGFTLPLSLLRQEGFGLFGSDAPVEAAIDGARA